MEDSCDDLVGQSETQLDEALASILANQVRITLQQNFVKFSVSTCTVLNALDLNKLTKGDTIMQESSIHEVGAGAQKLKSLIEANLLAGLKPERPENSSESTQKSALGLKFKPGLEGTTVETIMVGGPAHLYKNISIGDKILECDGKTATPSNISTLLVGSDIPGSTVKLKIQRGGIGFEVANIELERACSYELADRRKMVEFFDTITARCKQRRDYDTSNEFASISQDILALMEKASAHWMKMVESEQSHLKKIFADVKAMQSNAAAELVDMDLHVQVQIRFPDGSLFTYIAMINITLTGAYTCLRF